MLSPWFSIMWFTTTIWIWYSIIPFHLKVHLFPNLWNIYTLWGFLGNTRTFLGQSLDMCGIPLGFQFQQGKTLPKRPGGCPVQWHERGWHVRHSTLVIAIGICKGMCICMCIIKFMPYSYFTCWKMDHFLVIFRAWKLHWLRGFSSKPCLMTPEGIAAV